MAQSPRDENLVTVKSGSYNGVTMPLKADGVTGRLKAKLIPSTHTPPVPTNTNAVKDENSVSGALGSYNGTVKPLFADSNGNLKVTIM